MPKGSQTKEGQEIIDYAKNSKLSWDIKDLEQHLDRATPSALRSAYKFVQDNKDYHEKIRFYLNSVLSGNYNESVQESIESSNSPEEIVESVLKEASVESREKTKGVNYEIQYEAPDGYFIVGKDDVARKIFSGDNQSFSTSKEAKEHADISISLYLD